MTPGNNQPEKNTAGNTTARLKYAFAAGFSSIEKNLWILDVLLLAVAALMLLTAETVLLFHIIFVILTVCVVTLIY